MSLFDIPVPEETGKRTFQPPTLRHTLLGLGLLGAFSILAIGVFHLFVPASTFPAGHVVEIPEDASVHEMGVLLEEADVVRSGLVLRVYARLTGLDRSLESGLYVFERPLGTAPLVYRLATGKHGITPARVTFTEGMTVDDMTTALAAAVPDFDTDGFLTLASTSEGYLFPDTYFFMPHVGPDEVFERLRARFEERVETLAPEIEASGRTLDELVIMASILEREANTPEDMRIVAGILWKRIENDMLLQVDAAFGYIHGENGYTPTAGDLELDSPYNTYLYPGLPPTAIANPGLEALRAAALPTETDYFYYLTGTDGLMHYGRTFAEHKENRERFLD